MVYDDTRWVRLLKRMGCWNEIEARKLAELNSAHLNGRLSADSTSLGATKPTITVESKPPNGCDDSNGFDAVEFTASSDNKGFSGSGVNPLVVLRRVRSVRGHAREEYGKIHGALNPYYTNIADNDTSGEYLVFKNYDSPEQQAQLLAQLKSFSKADSNSENEAGQKKLSDVISAFETTALREFRNGYETGDIEGLMQRYARVLMALDGGKEAVELFIHHNHLITKKSDFGNPMDCVRSPTGAASLEQTQAFLTRLSAAFNEEVSKIDRCFSHYPNMSASFLDKIGKDVLSPYFNVLFDELHATSITSYLQIVAGAFTQVLSFAASLQPIQSSGDDFYDAVDETVANTFEPHIDLYLAEELDQFQKESNSIVSEWDRQLSEQAASTESFYMANINRQADKKDFLTSFKKVIMAPVNILPGFSAKPQEPKSDDRDKSPTPGSNFTSHPNRSSTLVSPIPAPSTPTELPTTELAAKMAIMNSKLEGIRSLFSMEVALNLVHSAKSSLERAAQFVKLGKEMGKATQQQCEAIFISLLDILGQRHVIAGFDKAVDHLSEYRPRQQDDQEGAKVEPLVTFLELVNVGDLILQMMDVFYEQQLIGSGLTDRNDFIDPAVKAKKKFEQVLDERVAIGLNKGIDVLMEEVDYLLATKQTAADFYPESVDQQQKPVDIGPSGAARAVVDVVSYHTSMLVGSTDKSTLDVFNQEIGLRLFTSLCKHLKLQRISTDGAIKLIRYDMSSYSTFSHAHPYKQ